MFCLNNPHNQLLVSFRLRIRIYPGFVICVIFQMAFVAPRYYFLTIFSHETSGLCQYVQNQRRTILFTNKGLCKILSRLVILILLSHKMSNLLFSDTTNNFGRPTVRLNVDFAAKIQKKV